MHDIDPKRARLDPMAVFPTPDTVLEHPGLTREEKIADGKTRKGLAEIILGVETDLEHPPPTKQGTS